MATGLAGRRSETAGGDAAGRLAVGFVKSSAGAHRLAAIRLQADALFGRASGDDVAQRFGADEGAVRRGAPWGSPRSARR